MTAQRQKKTRHSSVKLPSLTNASTNTIDRAMAGSWEMRRFLICNVLNR
jgi:hypothetical protein